MAGYYDVYVLSRDRSKTTVLRFLDRFLPDREESQEDYGLPHLSDDQHTFFASQDALLEYLESHPNEPYAVYWHSAVADDPRSAMVFPTSDECMIYGLSVEQDARVYLSEVLSFLNTEKGYIAFECPPPTTAVAFDETLETLNNHDQEANRAG